jgi:hypothetical protein
MTDAPTHCKHGHPWPENLKIGKSGWRHCTECTRIRVAAKPRARLCPSGHEFTPENTYRTKQGHRLCRLCQKRNNATPRPIPEEKLRRVFERLNEGGTISSVYGKWPSPEEPFIVSRISLKHFMRQHPKIERRITALAKRNRPISYKLKRYGDRLVTAPGILRNNGEDAFEAVRRATSNLWEGERRDVMSLMFLAIAEGRLLSRDAERRMAEFIREHRRQFSKFGPVSLDAPIFGDSATTLVDMVTTGLWQ